MCAALIPLRHVAGQQQQLIEDWSGVGNVDQGRTSFYCDSHADLNPPPPQPLPSDKQAEDSCRGSSCGSPALHPR